LTPTPTPTITPTPEAEVQPLTYFVWAPAVSTSKTSGDGISFRGSTTVPSGVQFLDSNVYSAGVSASKWETLNEFVTRRLTGLAGSADRISGISFDFNNQIFNLPFPNSANDLNAANIRCYLIYPATKQLSGYWYTLTDPYDTPISLMSAPNYLNYTGSNTSLTWTSSSALNSANQCPSTNTPLVISGQNYRIAQLASQSQGTFLDIKLQAL
jgi:hypothetical protein